MRRTPRAPRPAWGVLALAARPAAPDASGPWVLSVPMDLTPGEAERLATLVRLLPVATGGSEVNHGE